MKKKIAIIGCGGHAISIYEIILQNGNFELIGFINDKKEKFYDLDYLGDDDTFIKNYSNDINIIIGVGQLKNLKVREQIFLKYKSNGFKIPFLYSTKSFISRYAMISEGSVIMHNVIINGMAQVHENCIINNNALIEHSSIIGKNTHVSTGVIVNGDCKIGNNCFIGSNSTINHGVKISNFTFIPSHTKVSKDV